MKKYRIHPSFVDTEACGTRKRNRKLPTGLTIVILLACYLAAPAQNGVDKKILRGPVATRKHFPTDLLFLGFPMAEACITKAGTLSWALTYTQSNTFVKSGSVLEVLPLQNSRIGFSRELAEKLVASDPLGDAYFFDLEIKRIAFSIRYGLTNKISFGMELPLLQSGGGFMDSIIENFHSTLGIPDDERPDFKKNTAQAFVYLGGHFWHRNNAALSGAGIGDVVLTTRFLLKSEGRRSPALSARIGVKAPTGAYRKLRGSGSLDFGLSLLSSKKLGRNAIYLNFDAVFPGEWRALPNFALANYFVIQVAYERLLGEKASLYLQANSNTNPFYGKTRTGLNGFSHELTLGLKLDIFKNMRWSAAISENYAYFRNSPDLGFQLGFEMR